MVASDVELLRKAVTENPYEDVPRLAFADALDERGNPGDATRAEFIRTQIAMSKFGTRHLEIHAIPIPRGNDYMEVVGSYPGMNVGDRVDVVSPYLARGGGRGGKQQRFWGWRVTKILPDDPSLDTVRAALRRDEHSKPYPYRERKKLGQRCKDLWMHATPNWQAWIDCPLPEPTTDDEIRHYVGRHPYAVWADHNPVVMVFHHTDDYEHGTHAYQTVFASSLTAAWRFERGFVSHVTCRWTHWALWGDLLTKHEPITHVDLRTHPHPDGIQDSFTGLAGKDFDADSWGVFTRNPPASHGYSRMWAELLSWRWPSIRPECWKLPNDDPE